MAGYYDKNKDYSKELQRTDLSASERAQLTQERQNKIDDKYGGKEPNMIGSNKTYSQTYGGSSGGGSSNRGSSSSGGGGSNRNHTATQLPGNPNQRPQATQTPYNPQQAPALNQYGYRDGFDYSVAMSDPTISAAQRAQYQQERQNKISQKYGGVEPNMTGANQKFSQTQQGQQGQQNNSQKYGGIDYTWSQGTGIYGVPTLDSEVKNYKQGGVSYQTGPAMVRVTDPNIIRNGYYISNGYTVFVDQDGYAYKALKGVADYTPHQDINAGNGSYNKSGAWTDNEMLSALDRSKIQDIRNRLQRGEITGDQANQAANAIRAGYGYTIDKNGYVTDNGALSAVNDRRKQLGLSTGPESAELDYYRYLMGTDTSPTAQASGKVQPFVDYLAENGGVQAGSQQRVTDINAGSTPASNFTAQTGTSFDIGDGNEYLKELYAKKKAAELAALKSAYEQNTATLDASRAQIAPVYDIARNSAANQNALSRGAFQEMAVANGLNTGATGQAALAQDVVLQQNLSQIDREQAEKTAAIDLQRSQLDTEYRNAIAKAEATGDAELANALYEEYVRQQNLYAKYGGQTGGSGSGSSGGSTVVKPTLTASQVQSALKNGIVTDDVISAFDYYYGQGSYDALYGTGKLKAGTTGTAKTGSKSSGKKKGSYSNGSLTNEQVKQLQKYYGVTADGKWGTNSKKAAGGLTADQAWAKYSKGRKSGYSMGYDELKRTISDYMNRGGYQRAQNILKSHWNSLSAAQQQEISNMFK